MSQPKANLVSMRMAQAEDLGTVTSILQEAAQWLISRGKPLWSLEELTADKISAHVLSGMYWVAIVEEAAVGCVRFQLEDPLMWPDIPQGESAFVHRLAVRRAYAGGTVSSAMLDWARGRAGSLGRRWLRLDAVADRPSLRRVYERYGFQFHSERRVGPYQVARYQIGSDCAIRQIASVPRM